MAVSHQWFVQWSSPIVFADISRGYQNINPIWNKPINPIQNDYNYYQSFKQTPRYRDEFASNSRLTDHARFTGVTLWLTMLGLAKSHVPAIDTPPFTTLYKWKYVDFEFETSEQRQEALDSGTYIPENVLPLGLEIWEDRIWVTLPNWRKGVPATLATVSRMEGVDSPLLRPYPDWRYHIAFNPNNNCTGLTSVFRLSVDKCGRLWVLDSGQIDAQDNPKQICPPSIVVFDLHTDMIIDRHVIPQEYVLQDSLFSNIVVDSRRQDCSDLHLYITDTWRFGLLVFRERDARFWRFSHHYFFPDPLSSNYSLHGLNFQWTDGIFGLALTPVYNFKERLLFFHSMSGNNEFYVKTSVLQNPLKVNSSAEDFKLIGESRGSSGHSSASAIDKYGVMFYGLVTRDSVGCWDTRKPYSRYNLGTVAQNSETLVFPNDVKIDNEQRQSVWVITNRLPMFQAGPLNFDDYNYRILYADTVEAVRGTICDPHSSAPSYKLTHRGWMRK